MCCFSRLGVGSFEMDAADASLDIIGDDAEVIKKQRSQLKW